MKDILTKRKFTRLTALSLVVAETLALSVIFIPYWQIGRAHV